MEQQVTRPVIPAFLGGVHDGSTDTHPNGDLSWVYAGHGAVYKMFAGDLCLVHEGLPYRQTKMTKVQARHYPPEGSLRGWDTERGVSMWVRINDQEEELVLRGKLDNLYWLCGPEIKGNTYDLKAKAATSVVLIEDLDISRTPTSFAGIRSYFIKNPECYGLLWVHVTDLSAPMFFVTREYFGYDWPEKKRKKAR
tara:strand:+ start:5691 stop:6275 length:585 start_codon:yes stop_codon:yes gene_type:complete